MFIVEIFYIEEVAAELFGPFEDQDTADTFGLQLMARDNSMVASYMVRVVNKP